MAGDNSTRAKSPKGKEILAYASSRDHTIIEFSKNDDGELLVKDITDHVEELEAMFIEDAVS